MSSVSLLYEMVRVVLELDIVDQVMLENVLRALRLTTFKDGRDDTWMHENLKEGKRYKAGEKEGKRKRKHASGISKATPRKQIRFSLANSVDRCNCDTNSRRAQYLRRMMPPLPC